MDNDIEINKELREFLQNELNKYASSQNQTSYDFEKRYEESKKASGALMWKNMWSLMLICFASIAVVVSAIAIFTEHHNRTVNVEVREFNDINLRNILKKHNLVEENLRSANAEKYRLEQEREYLILQASIQRDSDRELLENMNIKDKAAHKRKLLEIEENYSKAMENAGKNDKRILELEEEIEHYLILLDDYDTEEMQDVTKQKSVIDSEGQLNEMQMQSLADGYEQKLEEMRRELAETKEADRKHLQDMVAYVINQYDPGLSAVNPQARRVVEETSKDIYSSMFSVVYEENASQEFNDSLLNVQNYYKQIETIQSSMMQYPQKDENAIKSLNKSIVNLARTAGNEIVKASTEEISKKDREIKKLEKELSGLKTAGSIIISTMEKSVESQNSSDKHNKICGSVLSVSDDNSVVVYLSGSARKNINDLHFSFVHSSKKIELNSALVLQVLDEECNLYYVELAEEDVEKISSGDWLCILEEEDVK